MDGDIIVDRRSWMLIELLQRDVLNATDLEYLAQRRIRNGIERFYREPEMLRTAKAVVEFVSYPGVRNKKGRVVNAKMAREANEWLERWLERQVRTREAARATK